MLIRVIEKTLLRHSLTHYTGILLFSRINYSVPSPTPVSRIFVNDVTLLSSTSSDTNVLLKGIHAILELSCSKLVFLN